MAERKYAEGTAVTVDRSLGEIGELLAKHGVKERIVFQGEEKAGVEFAHKGFRYRVELRVPPLSDFSHDPRNMRRDPKVQSAEQEKEHRRRFREMVLIVRAKLVAVAGGITTFEMEFLGQIVTETNQTVGEVMLPKMRAAAIEGRIPSALPMPGEGSR